MREVIRFTKHAQEFGPEGVKSAETEEVSPGIMLDFDSEGRVIGIEILDVNEPMRQQKVAA